MVASALSGEGKTSLACLLAANCARSGARTLLVDGDLRRPSIHRFAAVPPGPGLSDVLTGASPLDAAVHPTPVENLSVMPGGRWSEAVRVALSTPRWEHLVAAVRARYDCVVVDTSPVLPISDGLVLAGHVDGVLLSVLRDVSEVAAAKDAVAQLRSVRARMLGVVVHGEMALSHYRARYEYTTPAEGTPAVKDPAPR
jgi:capsular exopolysaccharide synthesis family protein